MGWTSASLRATGTAYAAAPAGYASAVTRLTVTDFRSYANLRLNLAPTAVALTGPNGVGKTNLLEALSLLAPGRGLRRARLADLVRREGGVRGPAGRGWAVAARLEGAAAPVDVGTGVEGAVPVAESDDEEDGAQAERRVVRIDGRPARGPAALAEVAAIRWLTPRMDSMFTDGAARRRRLLDRLASGLAPGHIARVGAYERAMRQRSRLLREPGWNPRWVAALEETMAEVGTAIAAVRLDYAGRLAAVMADSGTVGEGCALSIRGDIEEWLDAVPALEAETRFRKALAQDRERDALVGGAGTGPHRSDLDVRHANGLPARQCSTGEQKGLLFAMVEADARLLAAETGRAPLLLLDEVAAHLDASRRTALFEGALALGAQVWATGTDAALFESLRGRAQFLSVAGGAVSPRFVDHP